MPYIDKAARERLDRVPELPETKGELNYLCTVALVNYLMRQLERMGRLNYDTIDAAIAGVRGAADEAKRRLLDPYEDGAIRRNGDIYPDALLKACNARPKTEYPPQIDHWYTEPGTE